MRQGKALAPATPSGLQIEAKTTTWRNWGRSVTAHPQFVVKAGTVDEVQAAVRFARDHGLPIKPIGAGHSFSPIAATGGVLLDLQWLDGVIAVDGMNVTLGAGTNLFQLPALLGPLGLALQNMGDIDQQTIAGATSTGTHGTGLAFGGLATRIRAATLVTAFGDVLRINANENAELLPAVALGLGALGVLVDVTVECVPAFGIEAVERKETLDEVLSEWDARIAGHDHFEFYTWPHAQGVLTKSNTRLDADAVIEPLGSVKGWVDDVFMANHVLGGLLRLGSLVPPIVPGSNKLVTSLASERRFSDRSHAVFTSPRTFRFREMEYALPAEAVPTALREVHRMIDARGWKISMPIEVRVAAADDLWLSTAHGRTTGYIAVHRVSTERVGDYFTEIEAIFRAHDGRPHWGKMHTRTAADLRPTYARFDDFVALRNQLDPERRFQNGYLRQVLGE